MLYIGVYKEATLNWLNDLFPKELIFLVKILQEKLQNNQQCNINKKNFTKLIKQFYELFIVTFEKRIIN